ncbi:unnamed protein product [Merluccius merluccius]
MCRFLVRLTIKHASPAAAAAAAAAAPLGVAGSTIGHPDGAPPVSGSSAGGAGLGEVSDSRDTVGINARSEEALQIFHPAVQCETEVGLLT